MNKFRIVFVSFILLAFYSCTSDGNENVSVISSENADDEPVKSLSLLKVASYDGSQIALEYPNMSLEGEYDSSGVAALDSVTVDVNDLASSNVVAYLAFWGVKIDGSSHNVALALQVVATSQGFDFYLPGTDVNGVWYSASGTSHTCTGAPCPSCKFKRDASNKIDGCECKEGSLYIQENQSVTCMCNHTITTVAFKVIGVGAI